MAYIKPESFDILIGELGLFFKSLSLKPYEIILFEVKCVYFDLIDKFDLGYIILCNS